MQRSVPLLILISLLVSACGAAAGEPAASPAPELGETEILDRFGAAMDRDGQVFHSTITTTTTAGEVVPERAGQTKPLWTEEVWVVPDDDAARKIFRKDPSNTADLADETETLLVNGTLYFEDDNEIEEEEWRAFCPPGDPELLVAFVLEVTCESFGTGTDLGEDVPPLVASVDPQASYDGQPATAIIYDQQIQPESEPSPTPFSPAPPTPQPNIHPQRMEARLYFNPQTSLPLAWETRLWDHSGRLMVTLLAEFKNEFIPGDELAAGYFDPEAFGYVYVDPLAPLDDPNLDVHVYWLGERFEPGGDLPPVEIYEVLGLRPPGGGPGDQVMIEYEVVDDEPNAFGFRLQLWTPEAWESQGSQIGSKLWQNPCVDIEEIAVDGGTATIYQTFEPLSPNQMFEDPDTCPEGEHDRFMTVVDYGDTILTVNAPLTIHASRRGNENAVDPYDTLPGMRSIVHGLHLRNGEAQEPPSASAGAPTLEEVYAGLAATLAETGEDTVLHMTESTTGEVTGFTEMEITVQTWIDAGVPVARLESEGRWEYIEGEYVEEGRTMEGIHRSIILDRSAYRTSEGDFEPNESSAVEVEGCYGQPEALAIMIGCPGPTETSTTTVEWGQHDEQRVLVLVTEGTTRGSDEFTDFVQHTYLDPDTYLPIFAEQEGTFNIGTDFPQTATMRFEHEFVERSTRPGDFFELSAIGYTAPDHEALIDEYFDTPVYWLGEHFEPDGELPALTLWGVQGNPDDIPSYGGYIYYSEADNPHGPPVVFLEMWSATDWESGSAPILDGIAVRPCNSSETVPVESGKATIYQWLEIDPARDSIPTPAPQGSPPEDEFDCDTPGTTRYKAIVEFPETVIVIDAPGSSSPRDGLQPSPYDSEEGMREIVEGLKMR